MTARWHVQHAKRALRSHTHRFARLRRRARPCPQVMKIMPVQKQTRAGQRTRFKAFVVVGDYNGHVGLGVKCAKEVATAIRGEACPQAIQGG